MIVNRNNEAAHKRDSPNREEEEDRGRGYSQGRGQARDAVGRRKKLSGATDCQGHEADKSENIEIRNKEIYEFWHDINTCIAREGERGRKSERYTSFGYALSVRTSVKNSR